MDQEWRLWQVACVLTSNGRHEMVHLHWPHWTLKIVSDVQHQGDLQMIGFVFAVMMMIAAFLFAIFILILEVVLHFR
jgi:hypothetical protein